MTTRVVVSVTCVWVLSLCAFLTQGSTPPPRGHPYPIPSDDPHLQPSVNFAASSVNRRCNCLRCQTLMEVTNATAQVVTGIIYTFSFSLQESEKCKYTDCMEHVSPADCPPNKEAKPNWCEATVLATPWAKPPFFMQKLMCQDPVF